DLVVGRHFEHVARQLDGLLELGFADLRAMRAAERGVLEIFGGPSGALGAGAGGDRKSTRLNSSHLVISYAVFCLKKKNTITSVTYGVSSFAHRALLITSFCWSIVSSASSISPDGSATKTALKFILAVSSSTAPQP